VPSGGLVDKTGWVMASVKYEIAAGTDSDEEGEEDYNGGNNLLTSSHIPWQSSGLVTSDQNIRGW